jgi:hypothetical protein
VRSPGAARGRPPDATMRREMPQFRDREIARNGAK